MSETYMLSEGERLSVNSASDGMGPDIYATVAAIVSAALAEQRGRVEAKTARPSPEDMSNTEGEAWDALHDDSNIICTCDGCNYYSPTYDARRECSLNIYIEDIVLARVRAALRGDG